MLNKNNIYILIKNVKNLIASDEFRVKHSLKQNAFTRNRKLSFQDIIYFILGLPRKSLSTELDLFCEEQEYSVSKQAFSKARYKMSSQAFEDIFRMSTDIFQFTRQSKTFLSATFLIQLKIQNTIRICITNDGK